MVPLYLRFLTSQQHVTIHTSQLSLTNPSKRKEFLATRWTVVRSNSRSAPSTPVTSAPRHRSVIICARAFSGRTAEEEEAARREHVAREPCSQLMRGRCSFGAECFRSHSNIPVVDFLEQMLLDQNRASGWDGQLGVALKTWALNSAVNQMSLLDDVLRFYINENFPSIDVEEEEHSYIELVFHLLLRNGVVLDTSFLRWVDRALEDDDDSQETQQAFVYLRSFFTQLRGSDGNQEHVCDERIEEYDDAEEDDEFETCWDEA